MSPPPPAPRAPAFATRVVASSARRRFMARLGAKPGAVAPGAVDVVLRLRPGLSHRRGRAHAGAARAIADSAAGWAAQTLMAGGDGAPTVGLKVNLPAPARGGKLTARRRVERAGRTLRFGRAEVVAADDDREIAMARALGAFMTIPGLRDAP